MVGFNAIFPTRCVKNIQKISQSNAWLFAQSTLILVREDPRMTGGKCMVAFSAIFPTRCIKNIQKISQSNAWLFAQSTLILVREEVRNFGLIPL